MIGSSWRWLWMAKLTNIANKTTIGPPKEDRGNRTGKHDAQYYKRPLLSPHNLAAGHLLGPSANGLRQETTCPGNGTLTREKIWLYRQTSSDITYYTRCGCCRRGESQQFTKDGTLDNIPPTALCTKVYCNPGSWFYHHTGTDKVLTHATPKPINLNNRLGNRPLSCTWSTRNSKSSDNSTALVQAIHNGLATTIGDGSFKAGIATAAFYVNSDVCIPKRRKQRRHPSNGSVRGTCHIPGLAANESAYCGKLGRIFASFCIIEQACLEHNICSGTVIIACNRKEALNMAINPYRQPNLRCTDYDLLLAIWTKIGHLPITFWHHWVRGHQDELKPNKALDDWTCINMLMDELMVIWRISKAHTLNNESPIEDKAWSVHYSGRKITCKLHHQLNLACQGWALVQYWIRKQHFPAEQAINIDWDAIEVASKESGFYWCRQVTKQVGNRLPTGDNMMM